jgi:hypothetical protein
MEKTMMGRLSRVLILTALLAGCGGPSLPAAPPQASGFHTAADFGRATTKKGVAVDPVNIAFIGTRWEIAGVFNAAGWVGADPITLGNIAKQGKALFGKAYETAPFSNLYMFNRTQDLGYQKNSTDIKKRDHLRLWMSNMQAVDGRPVWFCAASRDIGIGLDKNSPTLITHKVETDRDQERDMVLQDLQATGRVRDLVWLPGQPFEETKPTPMKSDGRIALMALTPQFSLFGW